MGGSSLGDWPELHEGVRDEGCRYLFQLTRSDSPALLARSLRTTSTLFSTQLPQLKLQLELFLSYLIDRLTPPQNSTTINLNPPIPSSRPNSPAPPHAATSDATVPVDGDMPPEPGTPASSTPKPINLLPPAPAETKELMLETLTQVAMRPSFMVDCWANFDCSIDSEDLFERLIVFLTRVSGNDRWFLMYWC